MADNLPTLISSIKTLSPLILRILTGTAQPRPSTEESFITTKKQIDPGANAEISSFFNKVDAAIMLLNSEINRLQDDKENRGEIFPREIALDTAIVDYETAIMGYQRILEAMVQTSAIYRYQRLSIAERDELIKRYIEGRTDRVLVRTVIHTVTKFETLESIALHYNISDWQVIARFNDILPCDIETGQQIQIPIKLSPGEARQILENIPVFGSMEGYNAFGHDLPDSLEPEAVAANGDDSQSDLKVLDGLETISQGLSNIVGTSPGEHPASSAFGFESVVSDNVPGVLRDKWFQEKAEQALLQDARVAAVRVESASAQGESVEMDISVMPKNNNPIRLER